MAAKKMYLFFPLDADLLPRIERLKSGQLQTLSRSTLLLRLIRRGLCYAEKQQDQPPAKAGEEAIQAISTIFFGAPPCTKSTVFFWMAQKAAVRLLPAAAKNWRRRKRNSMRLYSRRFPTTGCAKHLTVKSTPTAVRYGLFIQVRNESWGLPHVRAVQARRQKYINRRTSASENRRPAGRARFSQPSYRSIPSLEIRA